MGEGPSTVIVRFMFDRHESGMTSSIFGSYWEMDILMDAGAAEKLMRGYSSVLIIKQLTGYDTRWLAEYAADHAVDYDGTTVYIHRGHYADAVAILTEIAKRHARWQANKDRHAPFPGDTDTE